MQALKIAATGMAAQRTRVDVIANNIANMGTSAFQTRKVDFSDLYYQQLRTPGSITAVTGEVLPSGVQLGLGVRVASISMEVGQGPARETGGSFDLAIEGQGYFEVRLPNGDAAYTRDGGFKVSGDGEVVTNFGLSLIPSITVPESAREIIVNSDGTVFARFDGQVDTQQIGEITLANFINGKGLEAIGENLFKETAASGQPIVGEPGVEGRGLIRQGYLEGSSVDVVSEITELIEAQRGYELNSQVLKAADEMLATSSRIR
ncbi:MAG: flagellar basal-body rod protein FlgG [Paracoccaceae bacterium]